MSIYEASESNQFLRQYTSAGEVAKYTPQTAGAGISYLLDHDYRLVYLQVLRLLFSSVGEQDLNVLEFGCGAGMNLLRVLRLLREEGVKLNRAIGTDFSPILIDIARREAKQSLKQDELDKVEFLIAKNESIIPNLSAATGREASSFRNAFHLVIGVNTIRYCHETDNEVENARQIFDLLVPGGICAIIDMNDRFLFFRSEVKNKLRWKKEKQCYIPSLEEYAAPFHKIGFEVLRTEHFCWVPHSGGKLMTAFFSSISPILNTVAKDRAMRSLVISRKPMLKP
jgi:SAM-dependent methyltransferase